MNDNANGQHDIAGTLYGYIVYFDKEAYASEERRENSLIHQATNMQTAFSFVSAAVFMVAPIVLENRGKVPLGFFLVAFSIISVFLLLCLVCATLAQWRFKRKSFPEAKDLQDLVESEIENFQTKAQREKYMANTYKELHQGMAKSNNKRVILIKISMCLFFLALIASVILYIVSLVILFA